MSTKNRRNQEAEALPVWKQAIVIAAALYGAGYLAWRYLYTFNPEQPIYSALFFACEVIGLLTTLHLILSAWKLRRRESPKLKGNPTVDVLIATYNEDVELVRTTLFHCLGMDYPHETYLLDDGRRPEMAALAKEMGAKYITRPNNAHAKAGNLNNALQFTQGDIVVTFDADGVPRKDFLTKLLGYFEDEKVALVQVPQTFYNLDSFQHAGNDSTWNEQSLFFDVLQRGRDWHDASMCCGSGALFRRTALEEIGGFALGTIVEDLHTSIKLHAAGFKSVYHGEPLAYALAPSALESFVVQRSRWALGAIQMMRRDAGLFFGRNELTLRQRLCYFPLYYLSAPQRLFYFLAPILFLTMGASPMDGEIWRALPMLPNAVLSIAAYYILSRGRARLLLAEMFNLFMLPAYLSAIVVGLFPGAARFKVTPKGVNGRSPLRWLATPVVITVTSAASFALTLEQTLTTDASAGMGLTAFFAGFFVLVGLKAIRHSQKKPFWSDAYAFFDHRPVHLLGVRGETAKDAAVSEFGLTTVVSEKMIRFLHPRALDESSRILFAINLGDREIVAEGEVVRCQPRMIEKDLWEVDLRYVNLRPDTVLALTAYFFHAATPRTMAKLHAPSLARKPVSASSEQRRQDRSPALMPVLVESGDKVQIGVLSDVSSGGTRMKLSQALNVGESVKVRTPWTADASLDGTVARCLKSAEDPVSSAYEIGVSFAGTA